MKRLTRLLRDGLVIALIAFASGIPNVVLTACGDDECATACDGDFDQRHCPPNCQQGACAKVVPSPAAAPAVMPASDLQGHMVRMSAAPVRSPDLPLFTSGVFHPPRALERPA